MTAAADLDRVWTVPNLLSLVRLGLSVVVFVLIVQDANVAATLLFLLASTTDWVDGWYARRYGQVSRLGRIFDPLVDKVLICGAAILVADPAGPLVPWMAVVIVVRELVVTAIRAEMGGPAPTSPPAGAARQKWCCSARRSPWSLPGGLGRSGRPSPCHCRCWQDGPPGPLQSSVPFVRG